MYNMCVCVYVYISVYIYVCVCVKNNYLFTMNINKHVFDFAISRCDSDNAHQVVEVKSNLFLDYITAALEIAYVKIQPDASRESGGRVGNMPFMLKSLSTIVSACLSALDRRYVSVASYMTCFMVYAKSSSRTTTDYTNAALCGGRPSRSLYGDFIDMVRYACAHEADLQFPVCAEVVAVFDNNSLNYRPHSARSGTMEERDPKVFTSRFLLEYCKRKNIAMENWKARQFDPNLAPTSASWKKKSTCDPRVCLFNEGVHGESDVSNGKLSDKEYLTKEIVGSLLAVNLEWHDTIRNVETTLLVVEAVTQVDEEGARKHESCPIPCLWCDAMNPTRIGLCQNCSHKLRTLTEIQDVLKQNQVPKYLMFSPRPPFFKTAKHASNFASIDLEEEEKDSGEEGPPQAQSDRAGEEIQFIRQALLSQLIDPKGGVNIKEVYIKFCLLIRLVGFFEAEDLTMLRQFCFVVTDFGATCLDLIDDEDPTPENAKFKNIIHLVGVFHECKMYLELVMDILFSLGGGFLAAYHTYESVASQLYLRFCGDLHKANDFLRLVVKPALYIAIIRAFVADVGTVDFTKLAPGDVYAWAKQHMEKHPEDLKFSNLCCFLFKILPAYELVKKGVRKRDINVYNSGRRLLLPLCFALGKTNYAALIVRDMIQFFHRAPPEVVEMMKEIYCLFDEGIDGKMEETNKDQQPFIFSSTADGIQAGALVGDFANSLNESMRNLNPLMISSKEKEHRIRTPSLLSCDIINCANYLTSTGTFTPNRSLCTMAVGFDNSPLPTQPDLSPLRLYVFGNESLRAFLDRYIKDESGKFLHAKKGLKFPKVVTKKTKELFGFEDDEDEMDITEQKEN
jgi:hypothetical protein